MPFNGSGVYTAPAADFPVVTQTVISSTHFNNTINDIATALSTCLTKDGQQTATANINFGGFRATNVGITAIAGSVGTPAINVSDTGTGLYRSAASELAVTVAGTQRARFDATGLVIPAGSGISVPTLTATTSVVTPLVGTDTVTTLQFKVNGTPRWNIDNAAGTLFPQADGTQSIGGPANRIAAVFTPIIDSGTTGSLSLKTNNGTTQAIFNNSVGHQFNQDALSSSATFGNVIAEFRTNGSGRDATINLNDVASTSHLMSGRSGIISFGGFGPQVHFQIVGITGTSTRNITVTGSNGGNPTISTTAGSLAITPAVVIAGLLSQGASPALTANINLPYASFIGGRRNDNTADIGLLAFGTTNGVTETVVIGDSSSTSAGVLLKGRSGGAAPNTSDISAGRWCVWRDTVGATTKLYYNNGGVIQSVALA